MWHRLAETNVQNDYRQTADRIISRMLQTTDTPESRDLSPMIVDEQRITLVNIIHNNNRTTTTTTTVRQRDMKFTARNAHTAVLTKTKRFSYRLIDYILATTTERFT